MTSDTALLERSAVSADAGRRNRRWLPDLIGCLVVCVVILVGYRDVAFGGRTFSASAQTPGAALGGTACGTPSGACRPTAYDDPRVDTGASAWQLEPWARINHSSLAQGQVPLWNDDEGAGLPLAANMQSAVFDPLLLPFHLHPTLLVQDLMFLLGLVLIGLGAYLAARMIGLRAIAATVSGSVFGLSGWFFVYSNSQWFRIYLYLGFLIAFIEWTLRSRRLLPVVLLGLSVGGMIVVGMPEPTFAALLAAGLYSAFRLFEGPRVHDRRRSLVRLAGGALLGAALAAPLLLPFREYLPLSQNTHSGLAGQPPPTDPKSYFLNWLMPQISPDVNRALAGTRTWVGAGAVLLALAALASPRVLRKHVGWPILGVGVLFTVQLYGGGLVSWTRVLPYWSQLQWPTFATPVIALCVALLAGIGVQAVSERDVRLGVWAALVAVLVVVLGAMAVRTDRVIALAHDVRARGGWPLAVAVAIVIVVAVAVVRTPRVAATIVAGAVIIELLLLAPSGFYAPREDPYPTRSWISYVQRRTDSDGARVFSPDGLLFPDTAGVYTVRAPTMLDALYVERYWDYISTFLAHGLVDRYLGTGPYEPATNVASNQMFDLLGIRYVLYEDSTGNAPPAGAPGQFRPAFRGDGVTVYENTHAAPRAFVVHTLQRVDDQHAALAALQRGEPDRFPDDAVQVTRKDMRSLAVVEADKDDAPPVEHCDASADQARVVARSPESLTLDVDTGCAGFLVLGDTYYPGWEATVNGRDAHVYATDLALRGIAVPGGHSRVEFRYRPESFRIGVVLFVGAIVAIVVISAVGVYRSPRRRARRDRRSVATTEPVLADDGLDAVP
jgi:hypothetical protein